MTIKRKKIKYKGIQLAEKVDKVTITFLNKRMQKKAKECQWCGFVLCECDGFKIYYSEKNALNY